MRLPTIVAAAVLVLARFARADDSIDGVYPLLCDAGATRLLVMNGTNFEIRQGTTVSGVLIGEEFRYFNGIRTVSLTEDRSIIEGHLWVGTVIRGNVEKGNEHWYSRSAAGELFGQPDAPREEFTWDSGTGRMRIGQIDGSNVKMISIPTADKKGERLAPVFLKDNHELQNLSMTDNLIISNDDPPMAVTRLGVMLLKGWKVEDTTAEKIFQKADALLKNKPFGFIKKGNVMIAPWSLDLGPAGLKPVKVDAAKLPAAVSSADGVSATILARRRTPAESLFGGPMDAKQILEETSTLYFEPDASGISIRPWGWDCQMNHGDIPGAVIWFPTADGSIVRFVYPAFHNGGFNMPVTTVFSAKAK